MKYSIITVAVISATLFACTKKSTTTPGNDNPAPSVTYKKDIEPLLAARCIACHGKGVSYVNGGDMTNYDSVMYKVNKGVFKDRLLVKKDMPPSPNPALNDDQRTMIKTWLDNQCPLQ